MVGMWAGELGEDKRGEVMCDAMRGAKVRRCRAGWVGDLSDGSLDCWHFGWFGDQLAKYVSEWSGWWASECVGW